MKRHNETMKHHDETTKRQNDKRRRVEFTSSVMMGWDFKDLTITLGTQSQLR